MADSLEAVLSDNTQRVYGTQWRLFNDWCDGVGLSALPAEPRTVARYLAARAGGGASIATIRLATSAISKAHEWGKLESPGRDPGVRASLKGWGRRLAKPQRQAGALTADILAVIRLTAVQPRKRGRGFETTGAGRRKGQVRPGPGGNPVRPRVEAFQGDHVDLGETLCAGMTAAAASPSYAPRPTSRPKGRWWPVTPPAAMGALDAIRPMGVGGRQKVFELSESQIVRRVKAVARAVGLPDWESYSGHSGRIGMARRMAQNGAPTHEIERQGRWKQGGGMVGRYTSGESAGSASSYL